MIPCDDDAIAANRAAEERLLELLSEMETFDFLLEDHADPTPEDLTVNYKTPSSLRTSTENNSPTGQAL